MGSAASTRVIDGLQTDLAHMRMQVEKVRQDFKSSQRIVESVSHTLIATDIAYSSKRRSQRDEGATADRDRTTEWRDCQKGAIIARYVQLDVADV